MQGASEAGLRLWAESMGEDECKESWRDASQSTRSFLESRCRAECPWLAAGLHEAPEGPRFLEKTLL